MSVERLKTQLRVRYSRAFRMLTACELPNYDCLYIDATQYVVMSKLFHDDESGEEPTKFALNCIDYCVHHIKPTHLICIAVDGIGTNFAKLNSKRQRRFKRDNESETESVYYPYQKAISDFVEEKLKTDPIWQASKYVLYGSPFMLDDSESKIFRCINYIVNLPDYNPNYRHLIITSDSDLILFSLKSHVKAIDLLTNRIPRAKTDFEQFSFDNSELVSIPIIAEYIMKDFDRPKEYVDDFMMLCAFLGNVYSPTIYKIDDLDINKIIIIYKRYLDRYGGLVTKGDTYDFNNLKLFFKLILEKFDKSDYENAEEESIFIEKLGINESELKKMCHDFLDNMIFSMKTFSNSPLSRTWNYRYHYAPPLSAIIRYMDSFESKIVPDKNFPSIYAVFAVPRKLTWLLPKEVVNIRNMSEYGKLLQKDKSEIEIDVEREEYLCEIPDINKIKDILDDLLDAIDIPDEYKWLMESGNIIDLKNNQKIDDVDRKPFSKYIEPTNSSLLPSFDNCRNIRFTWKSLPNGNVAILLASDNVVGDPESYIGRRVYSDVPYNTLCSVSKIIRKKPEGMYGYLTGRGLVVCEVRVLNSQKKFLTPIGFCELQ
ncbi:hypothetical protein TVAG_060380 [Trichomonas vaginalis G3]|uniref:Xrn1 N-terminal domain-containing protein n=1 Tax=Trichomonas vaginalis (strain ATCC PRA-98 / G3) TaxID=412133 RepID=A2ECG7_TRIV3|nr:5'-3' exonuclease protein [Trichomonas vaginalis G3]EAY09662.1 hypothetical protein TVAG_060380 [Trichomonas vaginalis G3]KAI5528664.1 5'-3' exonuclease protein [Trichomonas vaginalis G3]|eukprot:XP_001321885.1 hypothetical protein [Trichomonas vaginalis G3]